MAGIQIDGVNNKIDFDDDADTSISSATDDTLVIESGGVNIASITSGEFAINEGSGSIDFRVESDDDANMLLVDASGNSIGVGTNSPALANGRGIVVHGGSSVARVELRNDTSGAANSDGMFLTYSGTDAFVGNREAGTIQFWNNGSERARIASDGDLFLGTTSNYDGEILRANVDGTNNIATFTSSNNGGAGQITITNSFSASASTDETATVRFGLGNGGAAIQAYKASDTQTAANRDVGLEFKVQDDNSEQVRFRIVNNGDLLASDTSIGSLSDIRLKKDIEDLNYSIDTFKALKPRTFNWKNPWLHAGETNRRGFIAQELKEVDPYWVSQQKAVKKSDDVLDPATYYEDADIFYSEEDEIPEDKSVGDRKPGMENINSGDLKTEATYTYQYEKGDGSDYDLLNDGSELDNVEMIAKLGKKDAMYISVIQQLIARIEALEGN